MKSGHFSSDPNIHNALQNMMLPSDSSLVKRKFLDIRYATLSFSLNTDGYLPDEGDGPFPVIAGINRGAFFGWDKGNMYGSPIPKGLIENAVHLDSAFESNENIDKIFKFIKTVLK